jgi:hypothetical protein
MINIYVKAQSAQMQVDQHAQNGHAAVKVSDEKIRVIKTLRDCPSCKKQNAMDGAFCIYCGANLDGKSLGVIATLQEQLDTMSQQMKERDIVMAKLMALAEKNL